MSHDPTSPAEPHLSPIRFCLRVVVVAVQLVLVYYLGDQGMTFFYQGF